MNKPARWIGYLRGSRTGTLFFSDEDAAPRLVIGLAGAGDLRLRVTAQSDDVFSLSYGNPPEPFGLARVEDRSDNKIEGSWTFQSGAEGLFELTRVTPTAATQIAASEQRIWNREVPLGAITLYKSDIERLIAEMEGLVGSGCRTTIRANENNQILIESATTYLSRPNFVDVVRNMTISTEEVTAAPVRRILNVILNDDGSSQITTSSSDELWTYAATQRLESFIGQFTSKLTGWLRRHGLGINSFILIAILI